MKKKLILGTILALTLAITATIMAVAPTLATPDPNKPLVTSNFNGGKVTLQLPPPSNASPPAAPGTPSHPVNLRLSATDSDRRSTFGAHDRLYVQLWVPQADGYIPVAFISDSNAAGQEWQKVFWNNTFVWQPNFQNVIPVADNELEVWTESSWTYYGQGNKGSDYESSNTLIVNLTKSVNISLPWNLFPPQVPFSKYGNLSFTLPPMTLTFHETGDSFYTENIETSLVTAPFSGYTVNNKVWVTPSMVEVSIPSWIKFATLEVTGTMGHGTSVYVPPS